MNHEKKVKNPGKTILKVNEAKTENEIIEINIEDINDPPFHDRSSFDAETIFKLAVNIREVGLVNPVVVRKIKGDKYERISGFRRIEACKKLEWEKIPAIVTEANDKEALMLMISENLQRENINTFDEVCSVIHLIALELDMTEDEVKSFLYKTRNQESGQLVKSLSIKEMDTKEEIISLLDKIGKYNLFTFLGKMRVLNLNPLLITAIRQNHMPYTIALAMNKLKDDDQLKKMIAGYFVDYSPLQYVKEAVKAILGEDEQPNVFNKISRENKKFYKLPSEKQDAIKQKLSEIEALLAG
jgi:ParB family chromosome partitioning protein